jgi:predicted nucleic acid-binding protein
LKPVFSRFQGKCRLLECIEHGAVAVADVPASEYWVIRALIRKYADRDIGFTDATIVRLAERIGCRTIVTVDMRDFSVFRVGKAKRFELVKWFRN